MLAVNPSRSFLPLSVNVNIITLGTARSSHHLYVLSNQNSLVHRDAIASPSQLECHTDIRVPGQRHSDLGETRATRVVKLQQRSRRRCDTGCIFRPLHDARYRRALRLRSQKTIFASTVAISRAIQSHSMVAFRMSHLRRGVDELVRYVGEMDKQETATHPRPGVDSILGPGYTGHICVGTAALVADMLVHQAALCVFVWLVTPAASRRTFFLAALSIGSCASAMRLLQQRCWPDLWHKDQPSALPMGLRLVQVSLIADTVRLDRTTLALHGVSSMLVFALNAHSVWTTGDLKAYLSGVSNRKLGVARSVLVFGLPFVAMMAISAIAGSYRSIPDKSMLVHVFLSTHDSFVVPLKSMYLSILALIWSPGTLESESTTSDEKSSADGTSVGSSGEPGAEAIDTTAG
ncbi:hypothetical protein C8Q80DRAFT_517564 [Daedaleopsis nitida]|nr:hypothetical protein C8Q80DRAFT_517564 [Daedaleopsis nitida]